MASNVARLSVALRLNEVHFMAVQVIRSVRIDHRTLAVMNILNVRNLRSGYST